MRRRQLRRGAGVRPDDLHNRERWLVSYADFITLLFAFFVVMYSVSSVNEGKYKVLSDTLEGIFNAPRRAPVPVPAPPDRSDTNGGTIPRDQMVNPVLEVPRNQEGMAERRTAELKSIANQFSAEFDALVNQGLVTVNRNDTYIEVSLRNSLLFSSGDAEPHYDAFPVIEHIAQILRGHDNAILIEGFTDDLPINSSRYPSNWELSADRAATVVRLLAANGVDPQRMGAVGYGQFQPIARNDTPEGRRRNRRVVILISRDGNVRGALR